MVNLQDEISDMFLEKLKEPPDVTLEILEALRELLSAKKKPKADDLVKVFSSPAGGEVK